jgi:hypothetical protein
VTEQEWLSSDDPGEMVPVFCGEFRGVGLLGWLGVGTRSASGRKRRLCVCACCRWAWETLPERGRTAVEVAERYADGQATRRELLAAREAASDAAFGLTGWEGWWAGQLMKRCTNPWDIDQDLLLAASAAQGMVDAQEVRKAVGRVPAAPLLRDLLGNPFRPARVTRCWQTADVLRLAEAAYDERLLPSGHLDPARLAVLCDALLDARCPPDSDILQHLRGPGPHWRACWALDLLLGRG